MPLLQRTGSIDPGDASIGNDGGRAVVEYWVTPLDFDMPEASIQAELYAAVLQLLGDVAFAVQADGKLKRTPPLAHPVFKHMYCTKLDSIKGYGKSELLGTGAEFYEAPPLDLYAESQIYLIRASFSSLPYAVLPDNVINPINITPYDDDGNPQPTTAPEEWLRWVDIEKARVEVDVITAQHGMMMLRGVSGGDKQFPAMPSLMQPRGALVVTHFYVPYAWFSHPDNYYDQAGGKVNQTEIFGRPAGQLCLLSVEARRYTPPLPDAITDETLLLRVSQEKLCDIRMTFGVCPRSAAVSYTPTNSNHVIDGWNALPHIDRKYYYATTAQSGETALTGTPNYKSFEMRLLFKDPRA